MARPEKELAPEIVFRIAELLLTPPGMPISKILTTIQQEFYRHPDVTTLTRESIYPMINRAVELGYVNLKAPTNLHLSKTLAEKFNCRLESIRVMDAPVPAGNDAISAEAARVAMEVIKDFQLRRGMNSVGVGLGPGRGTLDFARTFSTLLAEDDKAPEINLYAISSGCPANEPQYSSISFFNLFAKAKVREYCGLFAETLVPVKDFEEIKLRPGVREVFQAKKEKRINLIVTSMGSGDDEHSLYRQFQQQFRDAAAKTGNPYKLPKWWNRFCGDAQYRPYDSNGPIIETENEMRPVTAFELDELCDLASGREDHRVILIARRCGRCGSDKNRAPALLPILKNPKLRIFNYLILDSDTAKSLLEPDADSGGAKT